MSEETHPSHDAVFVAGYEKGRLDGIAQAMAVMEMAMEYYPNVLSDSGARLLPGDLGRKVGTAIKTFGERVYRDGRKVEKEFRERKDKGRGEGGHD